MSRHALPVLLRWLLPLTLLVGIAAHAPGAQAAGGPAISDITFSRQSVDNSLLAQTVTVSAHLTSTSGVSLAQGILVPPPGGTVKNQAMTLTSGTVNDGVWSTTFVISTVDPVGEWDWQVVAYDGTFPFTNQTYVESTDNSTHPPPAGSPGKLLVGPPPTTTLASVPSGDVASSSASLSFGSGLGATFECRLDGGSWSACTSPWELTGLSDGSHTAQVRATLAGLTELTPVSTTWTVDTTPPVVTIGSAPAALVNTADAAVGFSSELGANFECKLDGGSWSACTSPWSASGLADGAHTLSVRGSDAIGNLATAIDRSWTVDTTAPTTVLSDVPATTTEATSASLAFTSEAGASFECKLDDAAWSACTSPVSLSGLAVGTHSFRVRARDLAGNVELTPRTTTWTVTAPPVDDPASLPTTTATTTTTTAVPTVTTVTTTLPAQVAKIVRPPSATALPTPAASTASAPRSPLLRSSAAAIYGITRAPALSFAPATGAVPLGLLIATRRSTVDVALATIFERGSTRAHRAVLAHKRLTVPAGATRTLSLRLPRAMRTRVGRMRRIHATLTLRTTTAGAAPTIAYRAVTLASTG